MSLNFNAHINVTYHKTICHLKPITSYHIVLGFQSSHVYLAFGCELITQTTLLSRGDSGGRSVCDDERHCRGVGNDCETVVMIQADNAEELAVTATAMVVGLGRFQ